MISSEQRFIGLNLGATNARLYYTSFNPGQNHFNPPRPILFAGRSSSSLPALVLLNPSGDRPLAVGWDVYATSQRLINLEQVRSGCLSQLESENSAAGLCLAALVEKFARELKAVLGADTLSAHEFPVTVGIPPEWADVPLLQAALVQAVTRGGFPHAQVMPDPVAALYYHIFNRNTYFEEREQSWLVVDIGGQFTRISLVKRSPGIAPHLAMTLKMNWGGAHIDHALLDRLVIPHYWSNPAAPSPVERFILLQQVREFKEKFSEFINQGNRGFSLPFSFPGINHAVELTRAAFESDSVCGGLMNELSDLLQSDSVAGREDFKSAETVILIGGGARWYFVQNALRHLWGEKVLFSPNPDLIVAQGLALGRTNFQPPKKPDPLPPEFEPVVEPLPSTPPPSSPPQPSIQALHKHARALIWRFALGGGLFALFVSPIPGASSAFLVFLEAWMLYRLSKLYRFEVSGALMVMSVLGLLALSFGLKVVVGDIIGLIPILGWMVKALVAGGVIWGLGEAAIMLFDKQRFDLMKK